jgi:hypothetical protein
MFTTLYQASGSRVHVPPIGIFLANDILFFLNFINTGTLEHWNKLLKLLNKIQFTAQNI